MVVALVLAAAVLIAAIDQVIKYFVYANMYPDGNINVIDNLFSLVYTENRGAAFGIFQNGTFIFSIITGVLIGVFLYLLINRKFKGRLFYTAVALIIGGGVGNLVDRIFRGFVIDYLSVSFFPPVCNFADYCVTVGAVLFMICIITSPEMTKNKIDSDADEENNNE